MSGECNGSVIVSLLSFVHVLQSTCNLEEVVRHALAIVSWSLVDGIVDLSNNSKAFPI